MDNTKRFDTAAISLSKRLSDLFLAMDKSDKDRIREIRIRNRRPVTVITDKGAELLTPSGRLTQIYSDLVLKTDENEVSEIFRRLCGYSVHSFADAINRGYITIKGGHRAGVAGTAVTENGKITAVRDICAINLRIAREIKGAADDIVKMFFSHGLCSVIIAGPPSSGKTTVLRDLARLLGGEEGGYARTVIIDEREEIAACVNGVPGNDIGVTCDVLSGYPKSEAVLIALRSMSPENIIIDEIGSMEEVKAVEQGLNSGVRFILSIHASSKGDFLSRPQAIRLIQTGAFSGVVFLGGAEAPSTVREYITAGELIDKTFRSGFSDCGIGTGRVLCGSTG